MRGSNLFEEVTARIVLLDSSKLVLINLVEPELVWSRQMGSKLVLAKLVLTMLVWFKKVRSKLVGSELEEEVSLRLLLDYCFFRKESSSKRSFFSYIVWHFGFERRPGDFRNFFLIVA